MPALPPLRLSGVIVICCLVALYTIGAQPVKDPDFWWHLATGRYMAAHHVVPRYDIFSLTAQGHRWITHEWVTELLFYAGWLAGGARLLSLVTALVIVASFYLVYLAAIERGAPMPIAASLMVLAAMASAHTWNTRPQMLTMLFTAAYGLAISRMLVRKEAAPPLWVAAVMLAWVNLHGGFIFGLAVLIICTAGYMAPALLAWRPKTHRDGTTLLTVPPTATIQGAASLRRCTGVIALTCLCTLVNPNGLAGALYPFSYLGNNASTRYISEWVSPDFHQGQYLFFEALVLLLLAGALASRRSARLADGLVLFPLLYLSFDSVRNIPVFAVIAAPIAAELIAGALGARRGVPRPLPPARSLLNWLAALAITLAGFVVAVDKVTASKQAQAEAKMYPVAALAWARTHDLPARGFNSYVWGGYLIWHWYPERFVFVDGRPDMYGDAFMDQFVHAYDGNPGWQALFARNDLCYALVEPESGIASALRSAPGWTLRFHDAVAVIYERTVLNAGCWQ